jgi:uncharacterized protein (TIGR02594 family)
VTAASGTIVEGDVMVVNASELRLRAQPSLDSTVLSSLPRGTSVRTYGASKDSLWISVGTLTSRKASGWMATKYLSPLDHPAVPKGPREEFAWMPIAIAELGVREVPGEGDSPRIAQYLGSTDLDRRLASNDETPWCSGFVNWCVETAAMAGTNSAAARSWLNWGKPLHIPRRGVITVLDRGAGQGHVGFFISRSVDTVTLLGGNQGDQVCVASYDLSRLLGYRATH